MSLLRRLHHPLTNSGWPSLLLSYFLFSVKTYDFMSLHQNIRTLLNLFFFFFFLLTNSFAQIWGLISSPWTAVILISYWCSHQLCVGYLTSLLIGKCPFDDTIVSCCKSFGEIYQHIYQLENSNNCYRRTLSYSAYMFTKAKSEINQSCLWWRVIRVKVAELEVHVYYVNLVLKFTCCLMVLDLDHFSVQSEML